jgi:hypothetical protein
VPKTVVPIPRTPLVYTAGTYEANLGRSPSEPANFSPAQFSFLPQPDFRTAGEPPSEHGDAGLDQEKPNTTPHISNQPAVSPPHDPYKGREIMRTFVFEAPMRPLDVAKNMYLDYTTTQSIKFYNKGCEKLPGEAFNGKMLFTWLVQVQDKANILQK